MAKTKSTSFNVFGSEFERVYRNYAKERKIIEEQDDKAIQFCGCGRTKAPQYNKCWSCMKDDAVNEAYERGFAEGQLKQAKITQELTGSIAQSIKSMFNAKRMSQLISLCHPDRHNNSAASNEITAWLLEMRKRF